MDVTRSRGIGAFMSNWTDGTQHSRQAFQSLVKALKDGDLGAAQDAFARLQPATAVTPPPAEAGAAVAPASPVPNDARAVLAAGMQALDSALESGDLAVARAAFETLQQDLQAMRPARHGRTTAEPTTMDAPAAAPLTGQDAGSTTYFGIDVKA